MSIKPGGDSGADVTQCLGDTIYTVGTDANKFPPTLEDKTGIAYNSGCASPTEGMAISGTARPSYQQVDNSGDHHGGSYTLVATNKIDFTSATGGVNINTAGNINLNAGGGIVNIMPTMCVTALSQTINIAGTDFVSINAGKLLIDASDIMFEKNAKFAKNVLINGGLFVNGELYVNHMTCQQQVMDTNDSPILPVYFNSPTILSGMFIQTCLTPILGFVPAVSVNQVSFILDPMTTTLSQMKVLPHKHSYRSPACSFVESTSKVWGEASVLNEQKPAPAKKVEQYGMSEGGLFGKIKETIISRISDYISTLI